MTHCLNFKKSKLGTPNKNFARKIFEFFLFGGGTFTTGHYKIRECLYGLQ